MSLPSALIGLPVNNISNATFLGTARAKATPGVEQNNPMLTLKSKKQPNNKIKQCNDLQRLSKIMNS